MEADVTFLRARLKAPPIWDPELHTRLRKTGVGGSLFFFSPLPGPCKEESGLAARWALLDMSMHELGSQQGLNERKPLCFELLRCHDAFATLLEDNGIPISKRTTRACGVVASEPTPYTPSKGPASWRLLIWERLQLVAQHPHTLVAGLKESHDLEAGLRTTRLLLQPAGTFLHARFPVLPTSPWPLSAGRRRFAAGGGTAALAGQRKDVLLPGGALEYSGALEGEWLTLLTGEASSKRSAVTPWAWVGTKDVWD